LERVLLFCLASDTDWQKAGVTQATAQQMMVRGLIERDQGASRFMLTEQGRALLAALIGKGE
jgi:predicted transcriptional regulator